MKTFRNINLCFQTQLSLQIQDLYHIFWGHKARVLIPTDNKAMCKSQKDSRTYQLSIGVSNFNQIFIYLLIVLWVSSGRFTWLLHLRSHKAEIRLLAGQSLTWRPCGRIQNPSSFRMLAEFRPLAIVGLKCPFSGYLL